MVTGMDQINKAILDKVQEEARDIIAEAEAKAAEEIEKAKKQCESRIEEEKRKLISEAEVEADRISAQASIKARQELLKAKSKIIDEIISKVKDTLSKSASSERVLSTLLVESIEHLETDKARIYIASKDKGTVEELVTKSRELAGKIEEIKETNLMGGVIVEDVEGKMRIDNSYYTRLEMLLPQILPEISKELF